ncbi:MAG: type II toxin-antitoxin system HicB family antitoxin [Spirochaetota bacterium]
MRYILSEYIKKAMKLAEYDKLEDGSFSGRIPDCKGVIAFGNRLSDCEEELHSVLEEWILLGIKMNHKLPIIDGIDLNKEPQYEQVDTL